MSNLRIFCAALAAILKCLSCAKYKSAHLSRLSALPIRRHPVLIAVLALGLLAPGAASASPQCEMLKTEALSLAAEYPGTIAVLGVCGKVGEEVYKSERDRGAAVTAFGLCAIPTCFLVGKLLPGCFEEDLWTDVAFRCARVSLILPTEALRYAGGGTSAPRILSSHWRMFAPSPSPSASCPCEIVLLIRLRPDFPVVFEGYSGGAEHWHRRLCAWSRSLWASLLRTS